MKTGFTLVEMAIVLLVMGLILSLSTYSKSAIELSKYHKDISKIKTVNAAIVNYTQRRNVTLNITYKLDGHGVLNLDKILKDQDLNIEDIKSEFKGRNGENIYFIPVIMSLDTEGSCYTYPSDIEKNFYGIYTIQSYDPFLVGFPRLSYVCTLENMMDDKNVLDGSLRFFIADNIVANSIDYHNCDSYHNNNGEDFGISVEF